MKFEIHEVSFLSFPSDRKRMEASREAPAEVAEAAVSKLERQQAGKKAPARKRQRTWSQRRGTTELDETREARKAHHKRHRKHAFLHA